MVHPASGCVGCDAKDSEWSRRGDCALHTVTGLGGRRRKGLEPSRRLSETTGPRSSGAFRVVVLSAEVTKCGARCKRPAAFSTHRAPHRCAGRFVTAAHRNRCTCSADQWRHAHMFPSADAEPRDAEARGDGATITRYRERSVSGAHATSASASRSRLLDAATTAALAQWRT